MDPFARLAKALRARQVRFAVIGVSGANFYARSGGALFTTQDQDLFLPLDPENLLRAWQSCDGVGLSLRAGDERLDSPRDFQLAGAVVERRAGTSATDDEGLQIDLSLVMAGFDFERVWSSRRTFLVDDVEIPVARLTDIVNSKAKAGREKDRLFLATHAEALRELLRHEEGIDECCRRSRALQRSGSRSGWFSSGSSILVPAPASASSA